MPTLTSLFQILIFPGFLFVSFLGLITEYVDRKLCAKLQNRVGPISLSSRPRKILSPKTQTRQSFV
jgi:NADH:ubiquinone oxidoreductase subunit H